MKSIIHRKFEIIMYSTRLLLGLNLMKYVDVPYKLIDRILTITITNDKFCFSDSNISKCFDSIFDVDLVFSIEDVSHVCNEL